MPIKSIVTKKGDNGTTQLPSGELVKKSDDRIEILGLIDKSMSLLGLARSLCRHSETKLDIKDIQSDLLSFGSKFISRDEDKDMMEKALNNVDGFVSTYESEVDLPKCFIIPGEEVSSSSIDVARVVIRELERKVVKLNDSKNLKKDITLKYLNRLSDALFLMARFEE
ncbi:cob(I)yrinic acid a,c-diamide adenosyltransferase [bacterium]|nr:cob(I)yrinic acid a,c-diamide adenosyltransferase [bacterium]